jgi:branched-chain amino acid transport system permease protein
MLLNRKRDFIMLLMAVIVLMVFPLMVGDFYLYLIRLISIYAILTIGLNIFMGYCGQINFGISGFFCIGAYIPTILQNKLGWHYLVAFPVGVASSILVAWVVSWPLLRLRSHTLAIGTLAFAMPVYLVFERFETITGGSDGTLVPPMILFGRTMGSLFYYYVILVFLAGTFLISYLLVDSRIGRAFMAVRDNEDAATAMGVDANHYRRLAWLVNAFFAGIAGGLYAQQAGFISPVTFALISNIVVLVMLCVGGSGTLLGPVVGAAIMTSVPYILITIQEYAYLVQGLILFAVLRFLPAGIVGAVAKRFNRIA